jgi:hypothetical protein
VQKTFECRPAFVDQGMRVLAHADRALTSSVKGGTNTMNKKAYYTNIAAAAFAIAAGAAVGCTDDNGTVATTSTAAYDDAYLYDGYYPADVAYASSYWAYGWDYGGFYYLTDDTAAATAGGTGHAGLAAAIKALARGQQICPGQATVTEKTSASICAANAAALRAGVTIQFNNCAVSGATINGTVDVTGTATASDSSCGGATSVNLNWTSTLTNLTLTGSDGRKLVIPNQTNTGMASFTYGQAPAMMTIQSNGELQLFDASGTMISDHTYMGDNTFTFSGTSSYSVTGTTNVQEKNGGATATISRQGLTRSGACCRPTGGSITVDRMNGLYPGQADWTFGPSCGQVSRNGTSATMPACM